MLAGKHVLLGVTGSIAAYQAADLIGLLKNELASVRVIMTQAATRFITPLTLEVISGHPVTVDMFARTGAYVEHITLARGAALARVFNCREGFTPKDDRLPKRLHEAFTGGPLLAELGIEWAARPGQSW